LGERSSLRQSRDKKMGDSSASKSNGLSPVKESHVCDEAKEKQTQEKL
jgi:hypothetical protein